MTPEQQALWERIEANTAELKASITMRKMTDALEETYMEGVAVQEQEQTRLENTAKLVGTYYNSLVEEGVPQNLVFSLVSDYQNFNFSRWMDEEGQ